MNTMPAAPAAVLEVQDLHFAHPGQPPLFSGFGFALKPGLTRLEAEVGKTSLVRLLAGRLAGRGRFLLNGRAWHPAQQPDAVCWIDPRDAAWDDATPAQLAATVQARHPQWNAEAWQRHGAGFELQPHRHKTMRMLSTGSRRKVALAASLAAGATLTLLDEPTAGLDQPAIAWLAQALAEQAEQPARAWLLSADWGLAERLPQVAVLAF